jgi:hypothetical protein
MRNIGQCKLALELTCERALERSTFGKTLSENANIQDWVAQSRIEIDRHPRRTVAHFTELRCPRTRSEATAFSPTNAIWAPSLFQFF